MPEVSNEQLADYIKWLVQRQGPTSSDALLDDLRRVLRRQFAYYVRVGKHGYVKVMNASSEEEAREVAKRWGPADLVYFEIDWPKVIEANWFLLQEVDLFE